MTQMSMGSNITLSVTNVRASLRWTGGAGVPDVDVSALLLDEDGEVASDADFVFYNQPNHYSGSVRIAGKTPPPQASDSIDVDLSRVPAATDRIVLAASADGGPFGQVPELQMVLSDLGTGQPVAYFPMQAGSETAIVSAELYRRSGTWKFRAVGQGYASGLAGLAADFGIDTGHADSGGSAAPESRAPEAAPAAAPAAPPAYPEPVPPPAAAPPPAYPEPVPPPAAAPPPAYPEPVPPPAAAPPPAYPEPAQPAAPPAAAYPPAPEGFAPAPPAGYPAPDASAAPPTMPVPSPPEGYPPPESFTPPAPYPPPEGYPPPTLDPPAGEEAGFSAPTLVESPAAATPVQEMAPPAQPMAPPPQQMAPPPVMPAPVQEAPPAPAMPAPQQPPAAPPPSAGRVSLQKNERVELRHSGPAPLTRVVFSLGWRPPEGGGEVDMDASVIAFDGAGEKLAIVWYMHLNEFAGALQHTGDNRTGGYGDVEQIMVDLVRMPANVNSLIFTINCFRGGTFTDIANAFCAVQNVDDGEELVRFDLADTQPSTALLMADLRRSGAGMWQMRAIGEFHDFRTVKKLLPAAARQATMA